MKVSTNPTIVNKEFLIFSLIAVVIIYLVANFVNQENFPITENWYPTDILFIITPSFVIAFGMILIFKYRLKGNHGKAWTLFTLSIISWFIGELTYDYNYDYESTLLSTFTSDFFYIGGYPLFFAFTIFYLKPQKNIITKKIIMMALCVSLSLASPTLYLSLYYIEDEIDELTLFLYAIYPILDSIILVPSIIAVYLFFRGKVNLLWTLILIATLVDVAADTAYLITSVNQSYSPSNLVNILYIWPYILYAFGQYSHIKLYKNTSSTKNQIRET